MTDEGDANTAVAVALDPGPPNVMVGADVYPLPAVDTVTPVTAPALTVAVPVAVVPPLRVGAEKVTVGAAV